VNSRGNLLTSWWPGRKEEETGIPKISFKDMFPMT
jgi:hypothetical protein